VQFTEHQHSIHSNKYRNIPFVLNVTLRQYIMFCRHFLATDLSEIVGILLRTSEKRRLHIRSCENLKLFKIHLILVCVLDQPDSSFNLSHFHSVADGYESRAVDVLP